MINNFTKHGISKLLNDIQNLPEYPEEIFIAIGEEKISIPFVPMLSTLSPLQLRIVI